VDGQVKARVAAMQPGLLPSKISKRRYAIAIQEM